MDNIVSVVIPTYNESENIVDIIGVIVAEVKLLREIIVVDDDSPDLTWSKVEDLHARDNRIKLIRRLGQRGLATAIQAGILSCTGDYILWLDADLSANPGALKILSDSIEGYDIVVASRYAPGGKDARREKLRVITSWLFNSAARIMLGSKTKDLTSGQIISRRQVFDSIPLNGLYGEYCVRFLYEAEKKGFKIKEIPYTYFSRAKGVSKTYTGIFRFLKYSFIYFLTVFKLKYETEN